MMWNLPAHGQDPGAGTLSDMHASWALKGAQEFVPGGQAGAPPSMPPKLGQGQHMPYPGWPVPPHMVGMPLAMPGWQGFGGMPPMPDWGAMPHAAATAMAPAPAPGGPDSLEEQNFLVIAWNLSPSYTREDLLREFFEMDFDPVKLEMGRALVGSCALWFSDKGIANACAISFDGTNDTLRHNEEASESLRFASWDRDGSTWKNGCGAPCDDVPAECRAFVAA